MSSFIAVSVPRAGMEYSHYLNLSVHVSGAKDVLAALAAEFRRPSPGVVVMGYARGASVVLVA